MRTKQQKRMSEVVANSYSIEVVKSISLSNMELHNAIDSAFNHIEGASNVAMKDMFISHLATLLEAEIVRSRLFVTVKEQP